MASRAAKRLEAERKAWRKTTIDGITAAPKKNEDDGSTNLFEWNASIRGVSGTDFEGGTYRLTLIFTEEYPQRPPRCVFDPVIFHPNVYPSGTVCLSLIDEEKDWTPATTLKRVLTSVRELLDAPNNEDPAQSEASALLRMDPAEYSVRVKKQAVEFSEADVE